MSILVVYYDVNAKSVGRLWVAATRGAAALGLRSPAHPPHRLIGIIENNSIGSNVQPGGYIATTDANGQFSLSLAPGSSVYEFIFVAPKPGKFSVTVFLSGTRRGGLDTSVALVYYMSIYYSRSDNSGDLST